ncbi:MAG: ABC transporter permease [Betaproteobacteria bacterium]|nr:ABC transporter permease [Betaproteobacteria bacterium]
MPKIVILWTDYAVYLLLIAAVLYALRVRRSPELRATWNKVLRESAPLCAAIVMGAFMVFAALDSLHFRRLLPPVPGMQTSAKAYATTTESLLDVVLARQIAMRERDWSAPFSAYGLRKESNAFSAQAAPDYPRLKFGGAHLQDPRTQLAGDITARALRGLLAGAVLWAALALWLGHRVARGQGAGLRAGLGQIWRNETEYPLRAALITCAAILLLGGMVATLKDHYHVFGTDQTGNDVLYQALKSIRTAFVIGTLSTLATLPFAIVFGLLAGYFKGWVDDAIQYLYTTLTAVPNVLLIAACVLMVQVYIDKHPNLFDTGLERADLKLFLLCVILGMTSWATLCRLLRAETLKLRELDYVQAAVAFGVGPLRIMARHIFPNVVHLILITTVLGFSDLILYEAVLSYVGVGVDPSMNSFGGMINLARSEMSRDPIVWWSFASAFLFMVTLVLAANLLSDGVQQAFDPRARSYRVRLRLPLRRRQPQDDPAAKPAA